MEGERLVGFLEHGVKPHVLVGVHRLVARRGDQEAGDARLAEETLDRRLGGIR